MYTKPSIPKGTRDFSTSEMLKRDYIFSTIRQVFSLYGYQPIETPAMENLATLLGKYGEEGDKLLFRILNSGDFLSDVTDEDLKKRELAKLSSRICEKGLRYDLTVPFARYVVQHRDEIVFPFRRYQMQPVWRADRPQKGRYREFYQCDVDVIGSNSLLNEVELIKIIDEIFGRLKIEVTVKLNNRKILAGIATYIGEPEKITDITVAIDKMEKVGPEAVNKELKERGLSDESVLQLQPVLQLKGSNTEKLDKLQSVLSSSPEGMTGVDEIRSILAYLSAMPLKCDVELDLTLARGLNYYTGAIIEVKAKSIAFGSICGGGRYDNLTGVFGLEGVSGVGISFGADRIYDVLGQLDLFDEINTSPADIMIVNFGGDTIRYALSLVTSIRHFGKRAELYPDPVKIKKQVSYADTRRIPYIIMAGEEEIRNNQFTFKTMSTGEQKLVDIAELGTFIKKL
jgi:histidyl-tRNA synthetase